VSVMDNGGVLLTNVEKEEKRYGQDRLASGRDRSAQKENDQGTQEANVGERFSRGKRG